jgi:hypothetical protein
MLSIPNEVVQQIVALVKESDESDPKRYAWVTQHLENDAETLLVVEGFKAQVTALWERFHCPRSIIIKSLLEGLTEDQMLLEYEELNENNIHVVLLFSKDKDKASEQAEILQDFLSSVEDVEVLTYIVKPTQIKET